MKILVTGGAGFVSSHVAEAYARAGHDVLALDALTTGRRQNLPSGVAFREMDFRDPALDDLFGRERFDVVNHQAARGNVRLSLADPMIYADVNVRGGINLLECCRRHGVTKVIYASTGGCVYGELRFVPADESHPVQPVEPYGASKAAFEMYLYVYLVQYGIKYTVLRYPNVYGPKQDPFGEAGVISIFARQMLAGDPVVINGDGEQQRDYLYVGDVARANLLALDRGDNAIYNLGWGRGISVNEVAAKVRELTAYGGEPTHGPARPGEVRNSYLDASRARRDLGWEPTVSFDVGMRHTVEYCRQLTLAAR